MKNFGLLGCVGVLSIWGCGGQTATSGPTDGGGGIDAPPDRAADTTVDTTVVADSGLADSGLMPIDSSADAFADAAADVVRVPLDGGTNLAVHQVFLGDTDRNGTQDPNAWAQYGINIDGKVTTATSMDVCTLYSMAPRSVQNDGNNGIDNSWGENIVPIIQAAGGTGFSTNYNAAINGGAWTLMLDVVGLTGDPAQTSPSTPAQLFGGLRYPGMPTWTPADNWPVDPTLLNDGMTIASGSAVQFPLASIAGGTWSSGAPVTLPLDIAVMGTTLHLVVHVATVTFLHSAPSQATMGVLAGVLNTQEFLQELGRVVGIVTNGSICPGSPTFQSIAQQIEEAQDILTDGTNTSGVPCNAISIGLGFNSDQIGPPQTVGQPPTPGMDPCMGGG